MPLAGATCPRSSPPHLDLRCHRIATCTTVLTAWGLPAGAAGGVAGWRLEAEGGVGPVVVVLIFPISDDDAGVRQ
jgi:hypothetical protein